MNPVYESSDILKLRGQLLGIENREERAFEDRSKQQALRQQAQARLENIRSQMWKTSPDKLLTLIGSIDVNQLPDMKPTVDRLRAVVEHLDDFKQLSAHPKQQVNLTNTLKRIVMLPPREAGTLKESYLRNIVESPTLKTTQTTVSMIKTTFPGLHAMESDWFGEIMRLSRRKQKATSSGDSAESYQSGVPGWLIWIGFIIAFRIIAAVLRSGGP